MEQTTKRKVVRNRTVRVVRVGPATKRCRNCPDGKCFYEFNGLREDPSCVYCGLTAEEKEGVRGAKT